MNWFKNLFSKGQDQGFAFTTWINAKDGRRIKIGVPVGMTVGELEDQLHEHYWSTDDTKEKS